MACSHYGRTEWHTKKTRGIKHHKRSPDFLNKNKRKTIRWQESLLFILRDPISGPAECQGRDIHYLTVFFNGRNYFHSKMARALLKEVCKQRVSACPPWWDARTCVRYAPICFLGPEKMKCKYNNAQLPLSHIKHRRAGFLSCFNAKYKLNSLQKTPGPNHDVFRQGRSFL